MIFYIIIFYYLTIKKTTLLHLKIHLRHKFTFNTIRFLNLLLDIKFEHWIWKYDIITPLHLPKY